MTERAKTIAKFGGVILKAYVNHMLVFTIGAILGAFEAFTILAALWGPCQ